MMRKINAAIIALFVSVSVNAATASAPDNNLNTAITKSIEKQSTNSSQHSTIVYGGKDISHSIVAAARESTWTKQQILLG